MSFRFSTKFFHSHQSHKDMTSVIVFLEQLQLHACLFGLLSLLSPEDGLIQECMHVVKPQESHQ